MSIRIATLLIFWIISQVSGVEIDTRFQTEITQLKTRSTDDNIKALEQFLRSNPDFAPAYHQLAKQYMLKKNPTSRQKSERALKRAINLEPQKTEYKITYADLLWEQGHWTQSMELCEEILSQFPNNASALSRIGYHTVQNYLKYRDMREGPATWMQESKKDYTKAIEYLKKSIKSDPTLKDPYYHLCLLYYENDRKNEMVQTARALLKHHPNDKDGLLFCGLGYQMLDTHNKAFEFYNHALEQMTDAERTLMENVELIAEKTEKGALKKVETDSTWQDTQEHIKFWHKRDPLLLTSYNEHRMTHYGRIAYANLRFSRPSNNIAGWKTDPGKTAIKFGRPLRRITARPYADVPSRTVFAETETWFYEGYQIAFRKWDGLDNMSFSPEPSSGSQASLLEFDANNPLDFPTNEDTRLTPTPRDIFNKTEHRYLDPYRDQKYLMPHQLATFKDPNGLRVELAYALPKARVISKQSKSPLIAGLFIFDENWNLVYQKKRLVKEKPRSHIQLEHPDHPDNYLLFSNILQMASGTYNVVVEALNKDPKTIGTIRTQHQFGYADTTLMLSDLLIAKSITPKISFPTKRADLTIIPNPQHTFNFIEPVFVYLETYNLQQDAFGQTQYEITYRLTKPKQKKIDPALFKAVDLPETISQTEITTTNPDDDINNEGNSEIVRYEVRYITPERNLITNQSLDKTYTTTAITNHYQGNRRDDFTYLQIDIERVPVGIHQLDITLHDRHSKQSHTRSLLFRIVN